VASDDQPDAREGQAEGFLHFVEERGMGPLFYQRTSGDPNKKHASKGVCSRVAAWIRAQPGFQDPRKAPNHAFRHWFKTELGALGVPDSLSDAIVGHGKKSEADRYRHYTVHTKAPVVNRVQVPGISDDSQAPSKFPENPISEEFPNDRSAHGSGPN
jgi:hypothetical protein